MNGEDITLIFGLGLTGRAGVEFLRKQGQQFFIADDKVENVKKFDLPERQKIYDIEEILNQGNSMGITRILLTPSVHAQNEPHRIVQIAKKLGIPLVSDVDIFYKFLAEKQKKDEECSVFSKHNKKMICITGTNGKSTTTALVAYLLNKTGRRAVACGNIGKPILSLDVDEFDYFVVEMSSYNLFLSSAVHFSVGVLLNITEDHIEYHGTMENYINAKAKAISLSEKAIVCVDGKYTHELVGVWKYDNVLPITVEGCELSFENLPGKHNLENILCAVECVCEVIRQEKRDIEEEIQRQLNTKNLFNEYQNSDDEEDDIEEHEDVEDNGFECGDDLENIVEQDINKQQLLDFVHEFHTLEHRIEPVKIIDGVEFINDSKGTNADSTQKALQTFRERDVYLLAGGQRKSAGFLSIKDDLKPVRAVFLFGEAQDSFADELKQLGVKYYKCDNLENATKMAFQTAKEELKSGLVKVENKPTVLLSPLCASWDQFKSFEHRGKVFKEIVSKL